MRTLLCLAVLVAGCATPLVRLPMGNSAPGPSVPAQEFTADCVPPGLPPLDAWTLLGRSVTRYRTEGTPEGTVGLAAVYDVNGRHVRVFWVDGLVAAVDPDIEDQDVPAWYDPGVALANGAIRAQRAQTCTWRRYQAEGATT